MLKPSIMTLRLPKELKDKMKLIAEEQGVSLNQLAMYVLAKEASSFETRKQFAKYWKGYDQKDILQDFDKLVLKVKKRKVPDWDRY